MPGQLIMALPNYSYGTAATTYGKNPADSYYAVSGSGGGGNVVTGSLTVTGPNIELGPVASARLIMSDNAGSQMRIYADAGTGAIVRTNAGGTNQTPQLAFTAPGNLEIQSAAGVPQVQFPAAGNMSMSSNIVLNDGNRVVFNTADSTSMYYDPGGNFTVIEYIPGRSLLIAANGSPANTAINDAGVLSNAFGTTANDSSAPISVPSGTPTSIFSLPLSGGVNIQQMHRILVGYSDGATNYECTYVDVGIFWRGTTSPHYTVASTGDLPPGWSLTVPVIGVGSVVFEHTFGAPLDVYVSDFVMGQNV